MWLKTHLNSGLTQVHLGGQLLADEGIRVVSPLEDLLQGRELGGAEGGAVPARLPRVAHWEISGAGGSTTSTATSSCNQGAIKLGIFTFTFGAFSLRGECKISLTDSGWKIGGREKLGATARK